MQCTLTDQDCQGHSDYDYVVGSQQSLSRLAYGNVGGEEYEEVIVNPEGVAMETFPNPAYRQAITRGNSNTQL